MKYYKSLTEYIQYGRQHKLHRKKKTVSETVREMLVTIYLLLPLLAMRALCTNIILSHCGSNIVKEFSPTKSPPPEAAGFLHVTLR